MARLDPLAFLVLLAPAGDAHAWLGVVAILDDEGRVRGRPARRVAPFGGRSLVAAAIDDEPFLAVAHLEREGAGMRPGRARVDDDERLAAGEPLEAGLRRASRRPRPRARTREQEVDRRRLDVRL